MISSYFVLYSFVFLSILIQLVNSAEDRCFENKKKFHAEDCENEVFPQAACESAFPHVEDSATDDLAPIRHENCDKEIFAEDALKCAKTCRICCERPKYDCDDKNSTFCEALKDKCVSLKEIMAEQCPHTCGLCELSGVPRCKDNSKLCAEKELKDSCNDANPATKAAIRRLCPKTCGDCPSTVPRTDDCKDEATNCDAQKDLCENTFYKPLMATECKLSCVWCIPKNYVCEDKNSADCERWDANGFCNNTAYTRKMRLEHCGKYCKMCS